ncbi:ATP-dependent protease ATP-binding subunit ClpX [Gorgonomyces haynaldii]|nr:ATP-dependent protease ATP-binding subunit ClpX [Gorgonomyces haynaldii]
MSVAIYNHYKRLEYNQREDAQELVVEKSNILLFGPTGSGKTLIVKTIAQMLDVPFSINDASPFTQTGYVGDDVDMCIHRLLQNADYDVQRAERGIVFIDEVDKLARRSDLTNPNQRDVSGEGVQQGLLRMLEGTTIAVNPKSPSRGGFVPSAGQSISVDTTNILFICSGAFVGLDKVILDRVQTKSQIGFKSQTETQQELVASNPLDLAEPEDVIRYGFIPELVGRLPCFAAASQLTKEQLCQILTEPKNSIVKQYQQLFLCSNLELLFHPEALVAIAEIASTKNTGARGLRRIMENVLRDALYELPGTTIKYVVVTKEAVLGAKVLAFQPHEQREAYMAAE